MTVTGQVDRQMGLVGNVANKAPCDCASAGANLVLNGEQIVDGVQTAASRVLVKDQTDPTTNGIYDTDTGAWTLALDCDGPEDLVQGTWVYVIGGTLNANGMFSCLTPNPIAIGTSALTWTRLAINYLVHTEVVAVEGQTVVAVGAPYQVGANNLAVFLNGLRLRVGDDYVETASGTITMTYGLDAGMQLDMYAGQAVGNLTAAAADLVVVTDAGARFVNETVEGVLQELADAVTVDNGDTSPVLVNATSDRYQRWNTPLTANRTATLSLASAREGATFVCVRGAGATGNFTLSIGGLAILRAPGEWCSVIYDSGTGAWVLAEYGILQSAEVRAMSADVGDASPTLIVGTFERTQRWATPLTAERTATLSSVGAYTGARFRIVRLESATGGFSLSISTSTAVLIRLAPGQWVEVEYSGTAWMVAEFGEVRSPNPNVVRLYDDFLGEEINGYWWQGFIGTDPACALPIVHSEQLRGVARLTTGAGAGASMATNGTQLNPRLNWQANNGGLSMEFRIMVDAITTVAIFAGFTNQDSALGIPIQGAGAVNTLTNNVNDALGVLFDTVMTTAHWWQVGVAAGVGAVAQDSGVAPAAATWETWRIDVSATGTATFYRNGAIVGVPIVGAVTPNVPLVPVVAAFSEAAVGRNVDLDFISVQEQR